jgi:hypothetical protein
VKKTLLLFFATLTLGMAYMDSDIDGVDDMYDKCPQTQLSDLVDYDGCSINSDAKELHFDIIFGMGFSQTNYTSQESADTITTFVQSDFYMDNVTLQAVISRYYSDTQDGSGWDDATLSLFYKLPTTETFSLNLLTALIFPTYKSSYGNEALDYRAGFDFSYFADEKNYLFGGYNYTFVNDSDFGYITYQNTQSLHIGIAHKPSSDNSYTLSYTTQESIYRDIAAIQTLGVGYSLDMDRHWFMGAYYDYGLSDSASKHAFSLSIGYFFN